MSIETRKAKLTADHKAKVAEVNALLTKGTNAEVEAKLTELANVEREYQTVMQNGVFASLEGVHDAILQHSFQTLSHQKVSENGVLVKVEKSKKTVQIDLYKFCTYKHLETGWYYEMQALNKRLTLKVALDLGMKTDEIRKIEKSYAMDKLAEDIDLGKTPTSNTQIIKHMQAILDELDPGCGRVNNRDLAFVMAGYTKVSNKAALKVVCSKHSTLQSLLMKSFHAIATNKGYEVEYKQKTQQEVCADTTVEKPKTEASKTSKKTDKPKVAKPKASKKSQKITEPETVAVERETEAA